MLQSMRLNFGTNKYGCGSPQAVTLAIVIKYILHLLSPSLRQGNMETPCSPRCPESSR